MSVKHETVIKFKDYAENDGEFESVEKFWICGETWSEIWANEQSLPPVMKD